MDKYIFNTHYGKSSVTDTENGVTVEWENGKYNETCQTYIDPTSTLGECNDAGKLSQVLARSCREIADYILNNYKDLI